MEKMKRIAAFLMVLVILGLVVWAFILGITGSEYFSAALFLCILVPVLFYGISLITKLLTAKGKELADQAVSSDETEKNNVENKGLSDILYKVLKIETRYVT